MESAPEEGAFHLSRWSGTQEENAAPKQLSKGLLYNLPKLQHHSGEDRKHQNSLNTIEDPVEGLNSLEQEGTFKS